MIIIRKTNPELMPTPELHRERDNVQAAIDNLQEQLSKLKNRREEILFEIGQREEAA